MTLEFVFYLCVYLVEGITAWQYFRMVFPLKRPLGLTLFATTTAYGAAFLWFNVSQIWLNSALFYVINFLLLAIFYSGSWKGKMFHTAIHELSRYLRRIEQIAVFPFYKAVPAHRGENASWGV